MKLIKQTSSNKKWILIVAILALGLVGFASAYALTNGFSGTPSQDRTAEEIEADNSKQDFIENTDENGRPINESPSNSTSSATLTVTREGQNAIVKTTLIGVTSGTCTLTVDGKNFSAPVLYQPDFSTCEGFSVALSEISPSAVYNLSVESPSGTVTASGSLEN